MCRIEQALNFIMEDHDTLDHHVEHQLAAVMDHIKSLIGKIEKREDNAENRIENIEKLIKQVSHVFLVYLADSNRNSIS
jgi:hypothetical protein